MPWCFRCSPKGGILLLFVVLAAASCRDDRGTQPRRQVIVLGFDGLDPRLCERMMDAGKLPNLERMRQAGGYARLGTTIPPQSPVAWASFITGANPGVHGIFDFMHRDPAEQFAPYYSAAETVVSTEGWQVGEHRIPLTFWPFRHEASHTVLKRAGAPFWSYLDEAGIPIWLYDIPANYPPSGSVHGHMHCLSGMGVPDLLGSYGTYQFFSEGTILPKEEAGGMRKPLVFRSGRAKGKIVGPTNVSLKGEPQSSIAFDVYRNTEGAGRIDIQKHTILLNEGEWSDWVPLDFELEMPSFLPNAHVSGICRFYLQEVRPDFRLYVTPINIDPSNPGQQAISEPLDFVEDISDELGLFYTSGFQEDHKALSNGVFQDAEYLAQARHVLTERFELLNYAVSRYRDGLLFFYFSSTDLQAHMFWWDTAETHPVRTADAARHYHQVIKDLYREADGIVGRMTSEFPDATLIVMSDHGFTEFKRQFNLNTWLRNHGYVRPSTCRSLRRQGGARGVDWSKTTAYGLGLNGLYLNLKGRERDGVVDPADRDRLLREISEKLLSERDPRTGHAVVKRVYRADEVYSGPNMGRAPDLLVGYHRGYRASWATTLGGLPDEVITDNDAAWSADHCIAADEVPGVLFSSIPVVSADPSLVDLAPTILHLLGMQPPDHMEGHVVLASDRPLQIAGKP